jgi:hypothetical protein
MALFFALITQEIVEALMPGGALHSWRRWSVALAGAVGGFVGAAGVYLAIIHYQYFIVTISLCQYAFDCLGQVRRGVVSGNDHADFRHAKIRST